MVIDLSGTLDENTPVYPGDPNIEIKPAGTIAKDGWIDHKLTIGNHLGTHIDAPWHVLEDGEKLNELPIDSFVGRGRYINATAGVDIRKVKTAKLRAGDIALFHTGISKRYQGNEYYRRAPNIPREVVDYLIESRVKMVGVDAGSVDIDDLLVHRKLLTAGVLIAENLTNLNKLAGKQFIVYALPLKLALDGAPARVVTVI